MLLERLDGLDGDGLDRSPWIQCLKTLPDAFISLCLINHMEAYKLRVVLLSEKEVGFVFGGSYTVIILQFTWQ